VYPTARISLLSEIAVEDSLELEKEGVATYDALTFHKYVHVQSLWGVPRIFSKDTHSPFDPACSSALLWVLEPKNKAHSRRIPVWEMVFASLDKALVI